MSKKQILATGGAGFIGPYPTEYFSNKNCAVQVPDNSFIDQRQNLDSLFFHPDSELMKGGIRNLATYSQTASGSVPELISAPGTSNEINISGLTNMPIASRIISVPGFAYAASPSADKDPAHSAQSSKYIQLASPLLMPLPGM